MAQTGSWHPPGADAAYPRTLLTAAAIPQVQAALLRPEAQSLYAGLYQSVGNAPAADNASSDGRRARATFAKNAAFVALLSRQTANGTVSALPEAEKAVLLERTKMLLESINTTVEPFATLANLSSYNDWQWRSKELIDYLIAYDLLRGAGLNDTELAVGKRRLQEFAGNLDSQSVKPFKPFSFVSYEFYKQVKNNHALMTAAALGMAAVVLNDVGSATHVSRRPTSWINHGLYTIDNVLWQDAQRQSEPEVVAGYAEGPYYFKYAFLNCLPFFRAMGNFLPDNALDYSFGGTTRRIRNPYFDPRYDQLYDWITAILLPDGRLPALEDSYVDMAMPELALTGKSQYVKPLHLSRLSGRQLNSLHAQLRDATVDMRAAYLAANIVPTAPTNPTLTVLPRSGNLIFRSGNDSLATYLHVYGKSGTAQTNSGGHSQADASSFQLHAFGQQLALDPGYLSYGRRDSLGKATNHNLILVDNTGPAIGAPGASNDALATIRNAFQIEQLAYGEVETAYQAATITRKTLFIRNRYFLLADFVKANAAHTYTWQLHGYGLENGPAATGSFTDKRTEHEGIWQKNGAGLLAHVTATGGATAYAKATNRHELTYNVSEKHTTLLVQKSGAARTQFLAALVPFATAPLALATTSTAATAALAATSDYKDIAFAQADTLLTADASNLLPRVVQADGLVNFYSLDPAGNFAQLFLEQGTTLLYGSSAVISSTKRATLSWQRTAAAYAGYASRATTLTVPFGSAPATVTGYGVGSFRYDTTAGLLHITLTQPSDFRVTLPAAPGNVLPVQLATFGAVRQAEAVVLTWKTASEHDNQGFAVERRATAETTFRQIGFVAGAGTITAARRYQFTDAAVPPGPVYYRLKQLDTDGKLTYSPIVALAENPPAAGPALTVSPVPASNVLHVAFTHDQDLLLLLTDQQGRTVLRQPLRQRAQLNVGHLAPGLYFLRALDAAGRAVGKSQKVLIQR